APPSCVTLSPGEPSGRVRVAAQGCSRIASGCVPGVPGVSGSATPADAAATTSVTPALSAGLRTPPSTALTARDASRQTEDQFFAGAFGLDKPTWRDQAVVARIG